MRKEMRTIFLDYKLRVEIMLDSATLPWTSNDATVVGSRVILIRVSGEKIVKKAITIKMESLDVVIMAVTSVGKVMVRIIGETPNGPVRTKWLGCQKTFGSHYPNINIIMQQTDRQNKKARTPVKRITKENYSNIIPQEANLKSIKSSRIIQFWRIYQS